MNTLRHPAAAWVIFAALVSICVFIYGNIEDNYQTIDTGNQTLKNFTVGYNVDTGQEEILSSSNGNIMEQLNKITIVQAIEDIQNSIIKITNPASLFDLVGGLTLVGIGVAKLVVGILIAPYSVVRVILEFYPTIIPPQIGALAALVTVYIGFILLSIYLRYKT